MPANIRVIHGIENLALSQDGSAQSYNGKVRDVQHISDFSQQDYQVRAATEVHVGLLQVPTTW